MSFEPIFESGEWNVFECWKLLVVRLPSLLRCKDFHLWQARMDPNDPRTIVIQGPSRDCHEYGIRSGRSDGITDVNDSHAHADREIANDPSRNTFFWKIVLPEGWELDNMSLSNDPYNVRKAKYGKSEVYEEITFNVLFAQWEIARKNGGRMTASHDSADNQSLASLFGSR